MNDELVNSIVTEVLKKISTAKLKKRIFIIGDISENSTSILGNEFDIVSDKFKNIDTILIAKMDIGLLARLSNCIPINTVEENIIKSILCNKRAFILKSGIELMNFKDTKRKNLFNLYLKYEEKLENLGFEIINNITEVCSEKVYFESSSITIQKKIITERDLINSNCKSISTLKLPENTLITPLADDFLNKNNIKILRFEG